MKNEPNFMGKDSFFWWLGVVEDRRDPKKLGRLRVRVLGAHTEVKQLIPTCELHWAYPYQPLTWNQAMNGLGHSPTGPAEGTWVWGFFKDNESAQEPIVIGTIGGIPEEAPQPCIGFYDPSLPFHELPNAPRKIRIRHYPNDGTGAQNTDESTASLYPRQTHPWGCIIGEPDTNRLARAEQIDDTIIGVRKRQRDVGRKGEFGGVPIAFVHPQPSRKWVEPLPGYGAEYPYNHVFESESGHIFEIDDTPGQERIHIWHRSGSYIEIGNQTDDQGLHGDVTMRWVGKKFEIVMENSYSHHQNAMNVTVDGEANIYCRSNANLQVDGDLKVHVQGNYEEKVHGNYTTDIDGNRIVKIAGFDQLEVGGNQSMHAGGISDRHSGGAMNDIAGGQIKQSAGGSFIMAAGGTLSGDAPAVHWNSGKGSTSSPSSPQSPSVPSFPSALGLMESRNESGPDPEEETKPDPNPAMCDQKDCDQTGTPIAPSPVDNTPPEVGQQKVIKYDSPDVTTPQAHIDDLKKEGLYVEPKNSQPTKTNTEPPKDTPKAKEPVDCGAFKNMTDFPPTLQLSPNFTLGDVADNTAVSHNAVREQRSLSKSEIVCNLQALCINCLEPIAAKYGRKNMIITSGFRNAKGGTSQHEKGMAADIQFRSCADAEYYKRAGEIKDSVNFDQLILEYPAPHPWVHVSYNRTGSQRAMVMTCPKQGSYKPGLLQMA